MITDIGLFDHMVLQRNAKSVSEASFSGSCKAVGTLKASVLKGTKPVSGFKNATVGKARGGQFTGLLKGLPVGGPYTIQLSIVDKAGKVLEKLAVKDVLVGDVWVAAGQSNMQGCGILAPSTQPHLMVRAFYMDDHWAIAKDPIHNLEIAVDAFHNGGNRVTEPYLGPRGSGPAMGFAREMQRVTGVPQGIIASAHGGTSMAQWNPDLKTEGGKSLYGANLRRCMKNGGRVAGVIWYQGESDANEEPAKVYTEAMKKLVAHLRRDLKDPKLPFVAVQIGRVTGLDTFPIPWWNNIRDQERLLPKVIRNLSVVPSIDLDLDDPIHIAGHEQDRLGRRLAYAMRVLIDGPMAGKPPIVLKKVTLQPSWNSANQDILVEFDNVAGKLVSGSRPVGFAVADTRDGFHVYRTELRENSVLLHTNLPLGNADEKCLYYGLGTDPVCNITDTQDRSIPAMGPIDLAGYRAHTPFVQSIRATHPLPGVGRLEGLGYPADLGSLPWRDMNFTTQMIDVHLELEKLGRVDHLLYFLCRIDCPEEMKLVAGVGYDGPVKIWINGQEKYHDPKGTNPATPDRARIKFDASAGKHEILVGLGTNSNLAWGIFLRFERVGLSKQQLKNGRGKIALPRLIQG